MVKSKMKLLHGLNGQTFFVLHLNHGSTFHQRMKMILSILLKKSMFLHMEFADYQFRPNCTVAMTVAPELFDPLHAVRCLNQVEERFLGNIGMKTLDPEDYRYRPFYVNSEDSADFYTAK